MMVTPKTFLCVIKCSKYHKESSYIVLKLKNTHTVILKQFVYKSKMALVT